MASWTERVEETWQGVERSFNEQMTWVCKTPLMSRPLEQLPMAPRKLPRAFKRYVTLKPRRLNFEEESMSTPPPRDSGVSLWSGSSASLGPDDVDKENRPQSRDTRKKRARPRNGIPKPEFRPMRI